MLTGTVSNPVVKPILFVLYASPPAHYPLLSYKPNFLYLNVHTFVNTIIMISIFDNY